MWELSLMVMKPQRIITQLCSFPLSRMKPSASFRSLFWAESEILTIYDDKMSKKTEQILDFFFFFEMARKTTTNGC